jgi:hypothetical protein
MEWSGMEYNRVEWNGTNFQFYCLGIFHSIAYTPNWEEWKMRRLDDIGWNGFHHIPLHSIEFLPIQTMEHKWIVVISTSYSCIVEDYRMCIIFQHSSLMHISVITIIVCGCSNMDLKLSPPVLIVLCFIIDTGKCYLLHDSTLSHLLPQYLSSVSLLVLLKTFDEDHSCSLVALVIILVCFVKDF